MSFWGWHKTRLKGYPPQAISNTIHGTYSGMWEDLADGKTYPTKIAIGYVVLMGIVIIINYTLAFNALLGMPTCDERPDKSGWDNCEGAFIEKSDGLATTFRFFSYLFFVLVAVIPPAKAGMLLYFRRDRIEKVVVVFALAESAPNANDSQQVKSVSDQCTTEEELRWPTWFIERAHHWKRMPRKRNAVGAEKSERVVQEF